MKVKKFMDDMRELDTMMKTATGVKYSDTMAAQQDIWSNEAAKGYVIRAAQSLGMPREDIKKLLAELHYIFDVMSVDEAEQFYIDF